MLISDQNNQVLKMTCFDQTQTIVSCSICHKLNDLCQLIRIRQEGSFTLGLHCESNFGNLSSNKVLISNQNFENFKLPSVKNNIS